MVDIKVQAEKFEKVRPLYKNFANIMNAILQDAIIQLGITSIVQTRAKGVPNFVEKLIRKQNKYFDAVNQFTDLCGARVIVNNLDDLNPVCNFIRQHFEIDEANSEDVVDRLGESQFGYRSVHFIISLKPEEKNSLLIPICKKLDITNSKNLLELLFSRRDRKESEHANLSPGPKFKAEIQVRTLIQHAWAEFAHDQIYKSDFDVPTVLKRDANRISATLETSDEAFARTTKLVCEYKTYHGTYMTQNQMTQELANLKLIQEYDMNNYRLAYQISRLATSLEDWDSVVGTLEIPIREFEASEFKPKKDSFMSTLYQDIGWATFEKGEVESGKKLLKKAVALDPENSDSLILLAQIYQVTDKNTALKLYEKAYKIKSTSPRALTGLILCKTSIDRNMDFLNIIGPALENCIKICRERANVGVFLPDAFYYTGFFHLLLGNSCDSLNAYSKAVTVSNWPTKIIGAYKLIKSILKNVGTKLDPETKLQFKTIENFLLISTYNSQKENNVSFESSFEEIKKKAARQYEKNDKPIVFAAGGCCENVEEKINEYSDLFNKAFENYEGIIISGGTNTGISKLTGDLKSKLIEKIAYLPKFIPNTCEKHPDYEIIETIGHGFTSHEPVQAWVDLIASGNHPGDIKLLGINGGNIAACEFRMALALGAKVGVISDSGRAVQKIINDMDWNQNYSLLNLPNDSTTAKCFIQSIPDSDFLDKKTKEMLAREAHENYRKKHYKIKEDPSLLPWEELSEDLRKSNLDQIEFIKIKLDAVGLTVQKKNTKSIRLIEFSPGQIEIMAEMEHGRWNVERLISGWSQGDRDPSNKRSPYLIAWNQLSEEIKDYDRNTIQHIPQMLKNIGYEIVK
jgi:ppGpp synthetase/RelA/SpoT-type nucleotidyltranferase